MNIDRNDVVSLYPVMEIYQPFGDAFWVFYMGELALIEHRLELNTKICSLRLQ